MKRALSQNKYMLLTPVMFGEEPSTPSPLSPPVVGRGVGGEGQGARLPLPNQCLPIRKILCLYHTQLVLVPPSPPAPLPANAASLSIICNLQFAICNSQFPIIIFQILFALLLSFSIQSKTFARQVVIDGRVIRVEGNARVVRHFPAHIGVIDDVAKDSSSQTIDANGAILKTDPDLEASLETAQRFRDDGNYRVATQIWQVLLERSGDALYSGDGETYYSLAQQVENVLRELPPEGLATYRINADASAKEILAQANDPNDIQALNRIVQLYFLSSLGDESAFRLGCIYLDRFDFIGAKRLFEKVLYQFPNSKIPREQLLLRIAMCNSFLGQAMAAREMLAEAEKISGRTRLISQLHESTGKELVSSVESSEKGWFNYLGSEHRYGVMPAPPEAITASDLVAHWQFYVPPVDAYNGSEGVGRVAVGDVSVNAQEKLSNAEENLLSNWRKQSWRPAGNLVFDGKRIYFKAPADMTAWEVSKIVQHANTDVGGEHGLNLADWIAWRSVWRNGFSIDEATQMTQMIRRSWGGVNPRGNVSVSGVPESVSEVQFFSDEIQAQVSLCDGILYSVEGARYDRQRKIDQRRQAIAWNTTYRRSRTNFLTAYDAHSGRVLWTLPKPEPPQPKATTDEVAETEPIVDEADSPFINGGGFMAAPVMYGELIIVPVNNAGAISVYALDPKQEGKTVWKSYLCDEPESGAEPNSTIHVSIDGSDLFVCPGMGAVFVLDPASGVVRFAKRYPRIGKPDEFTRRSGWTVNRLNYSGWSNDVVIPYGRQMICFASDTDTMMAFDRNNGDLIWKSEMSPVGYKVDYVLGIYNDVLYAAGRETVIAYDLKGDGRMIWGADQMFDSKLSRGRGALTENGLYIPVEKSIYHFSLSTDSQPGDLKKRVGVDLGTGAPVGNLYSDGERFWVHGGNRLYMLENVE